MILRKRRRGPLSPNVVSSGSCLLFQDHVYAKRRHDPEMIDMILRRRPSAPPTLLQDHVYHLRIMSSFRLDMIMENLEKLDMNQGRWPSGEAGRVAASPESCLVFQDHV